MNGATSRFVVVARLLVSALVFFLSSPLYAQSHCTLNPTNVSYAAGATNGTISVTAGAYGVLPLGICPVVTNLSQCDTVIIEPSDIYLRDCHNAVALRFYGGAGVSWFRDNIEYGYAGLISIGDIIDVEVGNLTGPLFVGLNSRLSGLPQYTCTMDPPSPAPDNARKAIFPLVRSVDGTHVVVTGFCILVLNDPTGGQIQACVSSTSYGWTATNNTRWITITSGSTGTTNGTVSYNIAANSNTAARTGFLTIGDSVFTITQASGDSVGDGIPDWWRTTHFGGDGTTTNSQSCATADLTGTGQNNLFKYVAGLDPTNPASVFRLRIATVPDQPNQKSLVFTPRYDGRTYTPMYRTNLLAGTWLPLTNTNTADNATERTITDLDASQPQKFYRIQISVP